MNPPTVNIDELSNIDRTVRTSSNDNNNNQLRPPRVNINIPSNVDREILSDDELGMNYLANKNKVLPKRFESDDISQVNTYVPTNVIKVEHDIDETFINSNSNPIQNKPDLYTQEDDIMSLGRRRPSISNHSNHSNHSHNSSVHSEEYDEPRSPRETLKEKRKILFKLRRYEKKGHKLSGRYSIHTPLDELQSEYYTLRKEVNLEQGLKVSKNILISACSMLEFVNNKFDPLDIVLDGWSEEINEDADNGDYDEVLEDLYDKYCETIDVGPEIKLLMMIGGSAIKFHLTHTILKTMIPNAETLLKQNPDLKEDIQDLISKKMPEISQMNNAFMPQKNEMAKGLNNNYIQKREMKGPHNVDDIIRELEESNIDLNMDNDEVASKNNFFSNKNKRNIVSIPEL